MLRDIKVFRSIITGGEPFIRKDILMILEELCKFQNVAVNTNAMLITREIASRLSDISVGDIGVALDGADAKTHEASRGKGSFNRTLRGIDFLLQQGLSVRVQATITKLNFRQIPQLVEFADKLGVRAIGLNHLSYLGRATSAYISLVLSPEENRFVGRVFNQLRQERGHFVSGTYGAFARLEDAQKTNPSDGVGRLLPCGAAKEACAISPDGSVIPCNKLPTFRCGNIRESHLLDIWQKSEVMNSFRRLMDVSLNQVEGCRLCRFKSVCRGGCRADAYLVSGSLTACDPLCWHICDQHVFNKEQTLYGHN